MFSFELHAYLYLKNSLRSREIRIFHKRILLFVKKIAPNMCVQNQAEICLKTLLRTRNINLNRPHYRFQSPRPAVKKDVRWDGRYVKM